MDLLARRHYLPFSVLLGLASLAPAQAHPSSVGQEQAAQATPASPISARHQKQWLPSNFRLQQSTPGASGNAAGTMGPASRQPAPVDAIAAGAKLTKADAARRKNSASVGLGDHRDADSQATRMQTPAPAPADAAQLRGIEKKDIRRGMVIAKPGSITPHTREADDPITRKQTAPAKPLKTKHDTVKNSISNIR